MKCDFCDKDLAVEKNTIPATWFGKYLGSKMVGCSCPECLKIEKNMEQWNKPHIPS